MFGGGPRPEKFEPVAKYLIDKGAPIIANVHGDYSMCAYSEGSNMKHNLAILKELWHTS
jgi:hypothetical protein